MCMIAEAGQLLTRMKLIRAVPNYTHTHTFPVAMISLLHFHLLLVEWARWAVKTYILQIHI